MTLLPTQPAAYLHVNLITWPLALRSTQTAKVSCLLTSDVLFDFCRSVCLNTHVRVHTGMHARTHTHAVK